MTDEEFNRYCAEVMGYAPGDWWNPSVDLNQMAEVFDKLWCDKEVSIYGRFFNSAKQRGIAKAMREFIDRRDKTMTDEVKHTLKRLHDEINMMSKKELAREISKLAMSIDRLAAYNEATEQLLKIGHR